MHVRARRLVAAVAAVATTVVVGGCSAPAPVTTPTSPAGEAAYAHLAELQRITDAAGGTRSTPSPGYDAAVEHVAGVLRAAGWDVSTPAYEVEGPDDEGGARSGYRNVVAQTRTGDPDHVVMAGAHLDSVAEGPGINDNGSGVAALLQIAEQLGGSPGLPATVRLAFWGSEEDDLDGSTGYVDGLDGAGRAALALYVNLDMVASPNVGYFVQGGTRRAHGPGGDEAGPAGSAQVAQVLTEELAEVGVTAQGDVFDGLSDYDPFIRAGVPTGGVFSGDENEKTDAQAQAWGGEAGEEFDPCYHEACDRLDDVDRTALGRFTDAVDASLRRFAASTAATTSGREG
jgi:aminopeptidase S